MTTDRDRNAADERDAALMLRVQADEIGAFGALFDQFGAPAYRLAYSVAGNATRAEDIVQEAFLSVWRSRDRFEPQRTARAWIMRTVRNRALDSLRHHRECDTRDCEELAGSDLRAPDDVQGRAEERDQAARLRATLSRLPPDQRDVIALAYFGELSAPEIANELSLPLGTVKGRMRLGLDKVRAADAREREGQ